MRAIAPKLSTGTGHQRGFSLIEVVVSLLIGAMILAALGTALQGALNANDIVEANDEALRTARLAMMRIETAVIYSPALVLPLADNPGTAQDESVRDPGVLALLLDRTADRDRDGTPDADNDGDGLFDEDPTGDLSNDFATGIIGVDDDNDGNVDEAHGTGGPAEDDDDEDGVANEDDWDGTDDDGDGTVDEDAKKDTSHDGKAGLIGVDDDNDSSIDEGDKNDDDEDGSVNEDWLDHVVFRLQGTDLIERTPVPWDENGGGIDGTDFIESVIAENVTRFAVTRLPLGTNRADLVDIQIEVTDSNNQPHPLALRLRVGSAQ